MDPTQPGHRHPRGTDLGFWGLSLGSLDANQPPALLLSSPPAGEPPVFSAWPLPPVSLLVPPWWKKPPLVFFSSFLDSSSCFSCLVSANDTMGAAAWVGLLSERPLSSILALPRWLLRVTALVDTFSSS